MQVRTSLYLVFIVVSSIGVAKAQSESNKVTILPPIYSEFGVEPALTADADSILTFTEALQLVVARHPQLRMARAQIAAAEGRLQQSIVRPNPELSTEVEDFGRKSESGPAQTTIGVEQSFELFGKRGARRAVAEAELTAEQFAAQQSLLELYGTVAVTFAKALGAQENASLARHRLELVRKIEDAVSVKVASGGVPKAELFRAQSATKLAEIELAAAEAAVLQERLALATLWGSSDFNFQVEGALDEWLTLPAASAQGLSVDGNPGLTGLQAQVKAREADIRLARSNGKPDVSLGAGYRRLHDDGSHAFLVWAAVPLPLFNRNRGGIAEATARLEQAQSEVASNRLSLEGEVRQLLAVIETQRKQISLLREQVIPPAQQAMEEMETAYRMGSQHLINVLDAQRTLSELQGMLVEALIAGAQATAKIEQLTGHRLSPVRR
ncbi:MAG: TolC family protein [Candidatus Zixiibacteriota bacterium]